MASRTPRRTARPRAPSLARRLEDLEATVAALASRLGRIEGGEVRVLRATPFDGRARAVREDGPKCPACTLVVDPKLPRCPFCGCVFDAVPKRLRPATQAARSRTASPRRRRSR